MCGAVELQLLLFFVRVTGAAAPRGSGLASALFLSFAVCIPRTPPSSPLSALPPPSVRESAAVPGLIELSGSCQFIQANRCGSPQLSLTPQYCFSLMRPILYLLSVYCRVSFFFLLAAEAGDRAVCVSVSLPRLLRLAPPAPPPSTARARLPPFPFRSQPVSLHSSPNRSHLSLLPLKSSARLL